MNELIEKVIEQIEDDIRVGDYSAIYELLGDVSLESLTAFLSDSKTNKGER